MRVHTISNAIELEKELIEDANRFLMSVDDDDFDGSDDSLASSQSWYGYFFFKITIFKNRKITITVPEKKLVIIGRVKNGKFVKMVDGSK